MGAQTWSTFSALGRILLRPGYALQQPRQMITATRAQATAMLAANRKLDIEQITFLNEYREIADASWAEKMGFPYKHKLFYRGILRNAALYLAI